MRDRRKGALLVFALVSGAVLLAAATSSARTSAVPSWCGPKKITLGLTDGFGGNSWRLVTTASARDEAKKCPSVTSLTYADGQGNTQKAISDIQGMVAKGVNALVVFPDAGKAILPALRSSYKQGVVTVPYRVTPGGKAGVDYNVFIDTNFSKAGEAWGKWILKVLPKGGNVLMLSGPKGNSQGVDENKGLHKILDPSHKYTFIGEKPFEVTNWDPALTQKVLSADIAKYKKIDVMSPTSARPSSVPCRSSRRAAARFLPSRRRMATSSGASGRRTTRRIPRSSCTRCQPRTITHVWRSTGLLRSRPAARSRRRRTSRHRRSRTRPRASLTPSSATPTCRETSISRPN